MIIDSHCHISCLDEPDSAIKRAFDASVTVMLNVGTSFDDFVVNEKLSSNYESIFLSCGIHPEYADQYINLDLQKLSEMLSHPKVLAVGEIGLDYFYNTGSKENQISLFKKQLEIAIENNLPVIIHARNADEDCIKMLTPYKGKLTGVLHCFSGSQELCNFGLEMGLYISASGIITFKNAANLREIFKTVPLNRLLVETDSPYLAPQPLRGKKNEPSFIIHTLECLAAIKNISVTEAEKITTDNFFNLFTGAKKCKLQF